jgi:hypothetical protein
MRPRITSARVVDSLSFFASPSAKRKRGQLDDNAQEHRSFNKVNNVISAFTQNSDILPPKLEVDDNILILSSGDVLFLRERDLTCYRQLFSYQIKAYWKKVVSGNLHHDCGDLVFADCLSGTNENFIIAVATDGTVISWKLVEMQYSRPEVHRLLLCEEGEFVTCAAVTSG